MKVKLFILKYKKNDFTTENMHFFYLKLYILEFPINLNNYFQGQCGHILFFKSKSQI